MKIYAVIRGCYSDQYLAAVFSSRELAEANIAEHGPDDDTWNSAGYVDEFELDSEAGHIKRKYFSAEIDLKTGEILDTRQHETVTDPHSRGESGEVKDFSTYFGPHWGNKEGRVWMECRSYESSGHALKLCAEARQAYLREPK